MKEKPGIWSQQYRRTAVFLTIMVLLMQFASILTVNAQEEGRAFATPSRVNLDRGKEIVSEASGSKEGQSSTQNPLYRVEAHESPRSVAVIRNSDNVRLLYLSFTSDAAWGFSPDEHRFVIHFYDGTTHTVQIYNLENAQADGAELLWPKAGTPDSSGWSTTSSRLSFSRNGKYLFYAAMDANSGTNTRVVEAATGTVRLSKSFNEVGAGWGFSPNEDSFLFHFYDGTTHDVQLFNLTDSQSSTPPVWNNQTMLTDGATSYISFSRTGKYLFYSTLKGGNNLHLWVVECSTGTARYDTNFTHGTAPGLEGDRTNSVSWGFSRDENTFYYAYLTTSGTVQWRAIALPGGTQIVEDSPFSTEWARWRFCYYNEAIGMAWWTDTQLGIRLIRISDGAQLDSSFFGKTQNVEFFSADDWHYAVIDGVRHNLSPRGKEPPPPDTTPPQWPEESELNFSDVGQTSLTVTWPAATDDVEVTGYRLYRGSTQIYSGDADTLSRTVTGLSPDTSYTFSVQARDEAENWSSSLIGTVSTETPDTTPPHWPDDAEIFVTEYFSCPSGRLYLEWQAAEDNVEVTGYRLYADGALYHEMNDAYSWMEYDLSGLTPGHEYTFKVEAGDEAGNWSQDGPEVSVLVKDTCAPTWPQNAALQVTNVGSSSATLTWDQATDDVAVTAYVVFRGYTPITQVPESENNYTVTGLRNDTEYTFRVIALDAAGNDSDFLASQPVRTTEKTDFDPPAWPAGSSLTAENIAPNEVTLTWTSAEDDGGIALYHVQVNGVRIANVPGGQRSYRVKNLLQGREYEFAVQAADPSDNWSTDGPTLRISIPEDSSAPVVQPLTELELTVEELSTGMAVNTNPVLSGNGRYLVFSSTVPDLVSGVNDGTRHIYRYDRETTETMLVSKATNGSPGNGRSILPAVSSDGRYVAFVSRATNLDPLDLWAVSDHYEHPYYWRSPSSDDVFVHDVQTGETEMVSLNLFGMPGIGGSGNQFRQRPSLSADGRYVVFQHGYLHFDEQKYPGTLWVYDRELKRTEPVNVTTSGLCICFADSFEISGDGRFVSYIGSTGFGGTVHGIFVYDRWSGHTHQTNVTSEGVPVGGVYYGSIGLNQDGLVAVFASTANTLVPNDTNNAYDIFTHDQLTGQTARVSLSSSGAEADKGSYEPVISADGRYVAFLSDATNLAEGEPNIHQDVFLHDRWTGVSQLMSLPNSNPEWDRMYRSLSISADGQTVASHYYEEFGDGGSEEWETGKMWRHKIFIHQQGLNHIGPFEPSDPPNGEDPDRYTLTLATETATGGTAVDLTGEGPYPENAVVSIKATPADGYRFVNWTASGGTLAESTTAQTTFTMPGEPVTLTAYFEAVPVSSIAYVANGAELSAALENTHITTIIFTANIEAPLQAYRLVDIDFSTHTLLGDVLVQTQQTGTMELSGSARPSITGNLTVNVPRATFNNNVQVVGTVLIQAVASQTWVENADGNDLVIDAPSDNPLTVIINGQAESLTVLGGGNPLTIIVNGSVSQAVFNSPAHVEGADNIAHASIITPDVELNGNPETVAYGVFFNPLGNGSVTARVNGKEIVSGEAVEKGSFIEFTALAGNNSRIKEWIVNGTALGISGETHRVPDLQEYLEVQVEFERVPSPDSGTGGSTSTPSVTKHRLHINVQGEGTAIPSPEAENLEYRSGTRLQIKAIPAEGWTFSHWKGPVREPEAPETTITLNRHVTLTAVFVRAEAAASETVMLLNIGLATALLNGQPLLMDVVPFIEQGRTMVPVRFIAKAFDAQTEWHASAGAHGTVTLTRNGTVVTLTIGSPTILISSAAEQRTITADVAARIVNSRTYLPLRAIGEIFGAAFDWGPKESAVKWVTFTLHH